MPAPPPDSESSGVYPSGVFPGGFEEAIDPAALVTRRGLPPQVATTPELPADALQTTIGHPALRQPHLPPLSAEDRRTLSRLLTRPQLHRFWRLVMEQEQAHPGDTLNRMSILLDRPSESERLAIAGVFGLKVGDGSLHLKLSELDASLRASRFGISLQQALLLVSETTAVASNPPPSAPTSAGATPSRATAAQETGAQKTSTGKTATGKTAATAGAPPKDSGLQLPPTPSTAHVTSLSSWRRQAEGHPVVQVRPELRQWLQRLDEEGLVHRLAPDRETQLMQSVLELLAALPSSGESLRPLAYRLLGDHHALDVGQPAGELALRALAVISRRPMATTPEERRKLWQWAGIALDQVSSDVLTLGLRPSAATALGRALHSMAKHGEPMRLTLRQIHNNDLKLEAGSRVYVCQHPVVVAAAAERYATGCRPLVATGERPGRAVRALLETLVMGGAKLYYHGDFDWQGIREANDLYRTFPFQPWRYRTGDYLSVSRHQVLAPDLVGHPVLARWDDGLADAMVQKGQAIEEERVLSSLLRDLAP